VTVLSPSLFSVSEVELVYRSKVTATDRPMIRNSANAFDIFLTMWDMNKIELVEQFAVLLLNRANYCLGYSCINTGGISECFVDPKIVFATALKANATSIIVAHNHPSGNTAPSKADDALTERLVSIGRTMTIPVTDHLIITPNRYYSFAEESLII
jgi:DNA repair protein RadC